MCIVNDKTINCKDERITLSRLRIIRDLELPSGASVKVIINTEELPEVYSTYLLLISTDLAEAIRSYDKENDIYESDKSGRCAFSMYHRIGNIYIELIINTKKVSDEHNYQFMLLGNKYAEKIRKTVKEAASEKRYCSN